MCGKQGSPWRRIGVLLTVVMMCLASTPLCATDGPKGWFGITVIVDASGTFMHPTINSIKVSAVAPNSPASVNDVRPGDLITQIGQMQVAGGDAKQLQAAMAKSVGEKLRLQLRHAGGDLYTVELTAVQQPAH